MWLLGYLGILACSYLGIHWDIWACVFLANGYLAMWLFEHLGTLALICAQMAKCPQGHLAIWAFGYLGMWLIGHLGERNSMMLQCTRSCQKLNNCIQNTRDL